MKSMAEIKTLWHPNEYRASIRALPMVKERKQVLLFLYTILGSQMPDNVQS